MKYSRTLDLCLRYLVLIIIGISNLFLGEKNLFYTIFTPLTIKPVFTILNNLYGAVLVEPNVIFFKGYFANLISACIAGAAYFFLVILNFSTPMSVKKRISSLLFTLLSFLFLNILRIVIFSSLLFKGYKYFDITHLSTWYFGSTAMIVLLWFINIKIFKISAIPGYTDISYLYNASRKPKRKAK